MLFDFEDAAHPIPAQADVCIVGAGAAGIALALALERRGKRVLLLEGGGQFLERRSQQLYDSEVTGLPFHGIHDGRLRVLGGTTTEWGGQVMELDECDFAIRSQVAQSGWPFPKTELDPFYRLAEGFERLPDDLSVHAAMDVLQSVRQHRPLALGSEISLALARFCPVRNFAHLYADRLRASRQIDLHLHANVVEVRMSPGRDVIQSLRIRSHGGRTADVNAGAFVLCMGGIETVRLLLQPPADGAVPWQVSGALGRHFHDHIACNGIALRRLAVHPAAR